MSKLTAVDDTCLLTLNGEEAELAYANITAYIDNNNY